MLRFCIFLIFFQEEFLPLGVILVLLVVATSAGRANQHQRFDQKPDSLTVHPQ